jgi:RimJ/RimL family protein N-acetyltransferase
VGLGLNDPVPEHHSFRITTDRLVIATLGDEHLDTFVRYRNDDEVARHQDWTLPYTHERARTLLDELAAFDGPTNDEWVQLAVTDLDGALVGDLAVGLEQDAAVAAIGYTIAPEHQGLGYATEAVGALVDRLVADGVHRVTATLDPDNLASARVLERSGFRFTGIARSAVLVRGEWKDDARFEILAEERRAWQAMTPVESVELVEITQHNVRAVLELDRAYSQRRFVSSVAQSYGDALVQNEYDGVPIVPWLRAVYGDGEPIGFVLVAEPMSNAPHPYVWRILVDWRHQRRGAGARAIRAVAAHWAARGATHIDLSCVAGVPGTPEGFYRRLGFEPTGVVEDGETEFRVPIERLL